jgi:hypothetical protein
MEGEGVEVGQSLRLLGVAVEAEVLQEPVR